MSNIIYPSDISPCDIFEHRRQFIRMASLSAIGLAESELFVRNAFAVNNQYLGNRNQQYSSNENLTSKKDALNYNIFYEFTTDKSGVSGLVSKFNIDNWKVSVDGLVLKPKVFDMTDLLKVATMEERIYRLLCVEGWFMVIP